MEDLNLQKTKIERLIEEKLEESERLQKKIIRKIEQKLLGKEI